MTILASGVGMSQTASAQDALARAKETGKVTVGIFNQSPWGFIDAEGEVKGQSTDVLKATFAQLGITEIETVVTEFGALIPGLESRRFDVVAAGLFINPERCKIVAFGNPDLQMGDGLLVRKGNPKRLESYADIAQNGDVTLAGGRGSVQSRNAAAAGIPKDSLLLFPDHQTSMSALLAGRVDAMTTTTASAIALAASSHQVERVLSFKGGMDADGKPIYGYPGLAFRKEDSDFRDAYNAKLEKLKQSGKLAEINKAYGFSEAELPPADLTAETLCE
ncbi:ectoine/hydroxyectoine ABC transporter substrate-binding protein EhuB [Paracoccus alcaliphilus]|nr:ectoine/hydroxyectoine ABC transporter substrate-binding protein EhuB [Paracoccus alcaliphilus]